MNKSLKDMEKIPDPMSPWIKRWAYACQAVFFLTIAVGLYHAWTGAKSPFVFDQTSPFMLLLWTSGAGTVALANLHLLLPRTCPRCGARMAKQVEWRMSGSKFRHVCAKCTCFVTAHIMGF